MPKRIFRTKNMDLSEHYSDLSVQDFLNHLHNKNSTMIEQMLSSNSVSNWIHLYNNAIFRNALQCGQYELAIRLLDFNEVISNLKSMDLKFLLFISNAPDAVYFALYNRGVRVMPEDADESQRLQRIQEQHYERYALIKHLRYILDQPDNIDKSLSNDGTEILLELAKKGQRPIISHILQYIPLDTERKPMIDNANINIKFFEIADQHPPKRNPNPPFKS